MKKKFKVLITGAAGFIGMHVAQKLLDDGFTVIGIDNLNDYYSTKLKLDRLNRLKNFDNFYFHQMDIGDSEILKELFLKESFDTVINLAAQAGVRYSLINPKAYIDTNINGFFNVLEGCRLSGVNNLIYASSSSVYGNSEGCTSEDDCVNEPISLYAASKISNELMAHCYSHLHGINSMGLRFFTAYGEWGRPDQSLFIFVDAILQKKPLKIFNGGKMMRDFTYVGDISQAICNIVKRQYDEQSGVDGYVSGGKYQIFNVACGKQISLMSFISAIENLLGESAIKDFLPLQQGDVLETFADNTLFNEYMGYKSRTDLNYGLKKYIEWHKNYYKN